MSVCFGRGGEGLHNKTNELALLHKLFTAFSGGTTAGEGGIIGPENTVV